MTGRSDFCIHCFRCLTQKVSFHNVRSSFLSITRFDGRALLDFIRDADSRRIRAQEKTEEEEELEEFVNFERYRDLIKHRRKGCRYFLKFVAMNYPLEHVFDN